VAAVGRSTREPAGSTAVVAVIGDPVAHSLSPVIHNAAFAALGLDWVYVALPVPTGRGTEAVASLPALGLRGVNVTMPHKADAAEACHALSDEARRLGVVNTVVVRPGGELWGTSTDGEGFVRSLLDAGVDPAGRRTLVLGAGGAARAVVLALARSGATITVAARRPEAAGDVTALAGDGGSLVALADVAAHAAGCDLVVNATPVGMAGDPGLPVDPAVLPAHAVVADLVYHPLETPLLAAARARGLTVVDGLGMLVHQAALAQVAWTGVEPPVAVMREAARTVVAARRPPGSST
jgi:shikimate dehydrogenase